MHAESDEFPWPKPGDILFRSDDHPLSNAWLNWTLSGWDASASGYFAAANLFVENSSTQVLLPGATLTLISRRAPYCLSCCRAKYESKPTSKPIHGVIYAQDHSPV